MKSAPGPFLKCGTEAAWLFPLGEAFCPAAIQQISTSDNIWIAMTCWQAKDSQKSRDPNSEQSLRQN